MNKPKGQTSTQATANENQMMLVKILQQIKSLITTILPVDRSSKEEILDSIDSVLQTQNAQKKWIESTILLSLETLQLFLEETKERTQSEVENKLVQEMFILGKLLERVYIYSTDIEYAQFYNKELAIRIDNLFHDKKLKIEFKASEGSLVSLVESIFNEIETKKINYFKSDKQHKLKRAFGKDRRQTVHADSG
jgi:hypothetical protein